MRSVAIVLAALCGFFVTPAAEARVSIDVDLTSQTMRVSSATGDYIWPISSARSGFRTPRGTYRVQRMEVMHHSHKYHNSPMPHSLFFSGGYAIHGTYATGALGRPASHGCIRIAPGNAAALYRMVQAEGARISIGGSVPVGETRFAQRDPGQRSAASRRLRYARQHMDNDATGLRGGYVDPSDALGYAPVVAPSFHQWMLDPVGY